MKVDEAYSVAQHKIVALLEEFFPQLTSPYCNRLELVSKLMMIVATTAIEITNYTIENMPNLSSPRILYVPICPKCSAEQTKKEEEMWEEVGIPSFFESDKNND